MCLQESSGSPSADSYSDSSSVYGNDDNDDLDNDNDDLDNDDVEDIENDANQVSVARTTRSWGNISVIKPKREKTQLQ